MLSPERCHKAFRTWINSTWKLDVFIELFNRTANTSWYDQTFSSTPSLLRADIFFSSEEDSCDDDANNHALNKGQPQDLIVRQTCFLLKQSDQSLVPIKKLLHCITLHAFSLCASLRIYATSDLEGRREYVGLRGQRWPSESRLNPHQRSQRGRGSSDHWQRLCSGAHAPSASACRCRRACCCGTLRHSGASLTLRNSF